MRYRSSLSACLLSAALALLAACGAGGEGGAPVIGETPASGAAAAARPSAAEEAPEGPAERGPSEVLEREFVYGATEDRNLVGLFYAPEDLTEPLPAIVLVHDWWGLGDMVRDAAYRLAAAGYAVLAVDLYGGKVATTAAQAEALMNQVINDRKGTLDNLRQAYDYLKQFALAPRIASVGFELGGTWSLESALEPDSRLDAVVTFYGDVVTDEARLGRLRAPLLGVFAENDEVIPQRIVLAFRNTLRDLHKRADVYIYSDVSHAFANPDRNAYNAATAEEAWGETLSFLDRELGGGATSARVAPSD